jgi:LmbE family N-acetylglucosaminyl deacetylase
LLAAFAHPDDESYGAGGTMALAAAAGNPVWVLCATNGDQGGRPGEIGVDHSLDPEIRCEELRCACRAIGAAEPIFLGYRDSGMEGWGAPEGSLSKADPAEVVERIVAVIRRLRPAVVVTFELGGVYGHPDHVACSRRATEAYWRTAAEPGGPVALYHQARPLSWATGMRAAMEAERRRSGETTPPSEEETQQMLAFERLARPDEEITTIVTIADVIDRKLAALACHGSQMQGRRWDDPEALEEMKRSFGTETFVRVDPPPAPGEKEERFMALDWARP